MRIVDFLIAIILLVLSMPLWGIVALAVRFEDGGPAFFTQKRLGLNGSTFTVLKFRTMLPHSVEDAVVKQAKEKDPRITRVGRLLRSTGLDELPQLLNVLRGEMSLVGPRALAVSELVKDRNGDYVTYEKIPGFRERLAVRPGLTSLATIYLPKDAFPRRKFRYDLLYIRKRSVWFDLRLILLSFWISLSGKWETRCRKV